MLSGGATRTAAVVQVRRVTAREKVPEACSQVV
ncbi:hypothetical protein PF003_g11391 [Phytophthora fragariae]|nr:hypothetical protein PF003_g11391 [Phytophthora fragariae]